MKVIVAAVLSAFLANPASAESAGLIGTGTLSCGVWLENSANPEARDLYTQWLVGFLSAHNYYHLNRQAKIPDFASVGAWLDSYCRNNPLHPVFFAAAALVEASGGQAAVHQWRR